MGTETVELIMTVEALCEIEITNDHAATSRRNHATRPNTKEGRVGSSSAVDVANKKPGPRPCGSIYTNNLIACKCNEC